MNSFIDNHSVQAYLPLIGSGDAAPVSAKAAFKSIRIAGRGGAKIKKRTE